MVLILLAGGVLLTIGDVVMKRWMVSEDWRYGAGGMLIWVLGLCCLAATLKSQNIAVASFMLVFFNIASLALVEWYVFHNILTPQQIVGLVLGLGAVLMLQTAAP